MSDDRLARAKGLLRAADRVRERQQPVEPAPDRVRRGLSRRRAASPPAARRTGGRQDGAARHRRPAGRRRGRPVRPHRRRAGRGAGLDQPAVRHARGRRTLYGRGACDMKGFAACVLAMVPAFQAAPLKRPVQIVAELRRGDDLPRLDRRDRLVRQGGAASRGGRGRRADDDGGRRRPQERCDDPHRGQGLRGAFGAAGARRQRHRGGGRRRQRDRPPRARVREGLARSPLRAALLDAACRDDSRRDRAQHSGPRVRVRLGVPRPAGRPAVSGGG